MRQILQALSLTAHARSRWTAVDPDARGHSLHLYLTGELDLATADLLRRMAVDAVQLPVRVLVLDFGGVSFCGAAGITAMWDISEQAALRGCQLIVTGVRPVVSRIFDIVGLVTHPTGSRAGGSPATTQAASEWRHTQPGLRSSGIDALSELADS